MTQHLRSTPFLKVALLVLIAFLTAHRAALFDGGRAWALSVEDADTLRTLEAYQETILNREPGEGRTKLYCELFDRIESGQIEVDTGPRLDRLVDFLASQLENPRESDLARINIAEFLSKHPHPVARNALWRAAHTDHIWLQKNGRMALVALRDERALDLLLDDVRRTGSGGSRDAFRMIGELGSARAIEPLEAILADSTLEERIEVALRAQQSKRGRQRDSEWFSEKAREESRSYRDAARRALRDVRLQIETGMVMPFDLDDHAHAALARQGFVILPEPANELYEHLRSDYPYVTADIAFHAFMILAGASFDDLERLVLRPRLEAFASNMVEAGQDRLRHLRSEREVELAHFNIALFAVIVALLKGTDIELDDVPLPVVPVARGELARIREHAGVGPSNLFEVNEDFTKYKPRGRYDSSPELRSYFQGMLFSVA